MPTAPNIGNYAIPTGKVYFQDDLNPTAGQADLGNCISFTISNTVTTKEHFRTYGGQRTLDKTVVTQVASVAKFTLDEITSHSVALFALGTIHTAANTDGSHTVDGLTRSTFTGILHVVGDNAVGPHISWTGRVLISPTGDLSLIQDTDNWQQIVVQGQVQQDTIYGFGKWTVSP